MAKYRKDGQEVEAFQFDGTYGGGQCALMRYAGACYPSGHDGTGVLVLNLRDQGGLHTVKAGEWIVTEGDVTRVVPDEVFRAAYEPVEAVSAPVAPDTVALKAEWEQVAGGPMLNTTHAKVTRMASLGYRMLARIEQLEQSLKVGPQRALVAERLADAAERYMALATTPEMRLAASRLEDAVTVYQTARVPDA